MNLLQAYEYFIGVARVFAQEQAIDMIDEVELIAPYKDLPKMYIFFEGANGWIAGSLLLLLACLFIVIAMYTHVQITKKRRGTRRAK